MPAPGPWSQPDPPKPPAGRRPRGPAPQGPLRVLIWLVPAILLLILALVRLYPGRVDTQVGWANVGGALLLVAFVGARLMTARLKAAQALQHLAVWTGVAAILLLGYSFKDSVGPLLSRMRSAAVPGYPVASPDGAVMVSREEDGGFYVMARVNGQPVRFAVDTGSSDIVLSPADARRIGLDMAGLNYVRPSETANGIGYGAPVTVDRLQVGPIDLHDVPMEVNKAPMNVSLLGMAFLGRLKSFHFEGDRLVLQPR